MKKTCIKKYSLVFISSILLFFGLNEIIFAKVVVVGSTKEDGGVLITANEGIDIFTKKKSGFKSYTAAARFNFHPIQTIITRGATLNIKSKKLSTSSFSAEYNRNETHGTGGSVNFAISAEEGEKICKNGKVTKGIKISAKINSKIIPGKTTPPKKSFN